MESFQETYQSLRGQPLKFQVVIVAVAVVLTLSAILIPLLIRPSSDPDASTVDRSSGVGVKRIESYEFDMNPYQQSGSDSGWVEMPSGDANDMPAFGDTNDMPSSGDTNDVPTFGDTNDMPSSGDTDNMPAFGDNNEIGASDDIDMGSASGDTITENCGGHMTDAMRLRLLRLHNKVRSTVAKGNYRIDAPGSALQMLPSAVRMYQLKYNCSLERSALRWARQAQCQMVHSKWPGIGENLYASGSPRSFMYSANESVVLWADEIRKFGVQQDINEWSHDTGHATQIFWDRTWSVGCGIITCEDRQTSVVCHYYPQGNWRGQKWYTAGETLSECGKASEQHPNHEEGFSMYDDDDSNFITRLKRDAKKEIPHWETGLCEISA